MVLFIAGTVTGAFYGLAPVYGAKQGLSSSQVAIFVAASVATGLVAQWPLGWLADRVNRAGMIRINALLLALLSVPLWGWMSFPFWALVVFSCVYGALQFTMYPLGAAFANDNVDPDRRVGLSAILYMVYGIGACVGPLVAGALMREINPNMYFVFVSVSTGLLVIFLRPQRITGDHLSQDAPTQFVPMSDSLQSSNVVAALDPRVDLESDVSFEPFESDELTEHQAAQHPDNHPPESSQDPDTAEADLLHVPGQAAAPQHRADDPAASKPATPAAGSKPKQSAGDQNNDRADGQGDAQRVDPR
jgi:hypothetical protein